MSTKNHVKDEEKTHDIKSIFTPPNTTGKVLCCLCGASTAPNPSNMCLRCISTQIDVTEGIQTEVSVIYCDNCGSYLQPPNSWIKADLESRQLLAILLKKIKGLNKIRLIDAEFVWTEPHSKRIKIKLTVQKEFNGAIVQGSFITTFTILYNMCIKCNRINTNKEYWGACVQVRQHVDHKKTFFYLEQLILKHHMQDQTINIKKEHEGVDFYFETKGQALKFVDFLQTVILVRTRSDKSLVSHNTKSNTYNFKYTFSVEIAPICRDDMLFFPKSLSTLFGGIGPVILCDHIGNTLRFVDPLTAKKINLDASQYWKYSLKSISESKRLMKFIIIDKEDIKSENGHLANLEVARESDLGCNDITYSITTHLGNKLKIGDAILGYNLLHSNFNNEDMDKYVTSGKSLPDIVIVKKSYERARRKRKQKGIKRNWKLKHIMEPVNTEEEFDDKEKFMEDLEENPELRDMVDIYVDPTIGNKKTKVDKADADSEEEEEEEKDLEIPIEDLIDELTL